MRAIIRFKGGPSYNLSNGTYRIARRHHEQRNVPFIEGPGIQEGGRNLSDGPDITISRDHHLAIDVSNDYVRLRDEGSSNGCFYDDEVKRFKEKKIREPGRHTVIIGHHILAEIVTSD